jgi:PAS domain S-box-containing protein
MTDLLRLLIVEDSDNDAQLIVREIQRNGYKVTFERVETAAAMQAALTRQTWDLIICDYSLPVFDAPHALEVVKASGKDLPFIILSGTIGEDTAVSALKAGAHDFMIKTNMTRLGPAIQRELQEAEVRRERRQAQEALRESERRYRSLFEDSPISIWEEDFSLVKRRIDELRQQGIIDFKAYFESHPEVVMECASLIKVVDVNKVSINLYEAKSKDDLLNNLGKVLNPEKVGSFRDELINITEGKTDFQWEGENHTLAGKSLYVHLQWSVIPEHKDTLSRVIVSIIDITENKRNMLALHEAEARNRTLIEQLPMIVYVNSPDDIRHTTFVSPQIEKVLGYTPEAWVADPTFWQKVLHPEDRQRVLERIEQVNQTGEPFDMEFRMFTSDGHIVWLRDQAIPITDPEGRHLYWQGLMIDVTEPKQRERELEAIAKITTALREARTVNEILPRLLDEALSLIETDSGSIWLQDPNTAELNLTIHRGEEVGSASLYSEIQNIPNLVAARREAIISREFRNDTHIPEESRKRIPQGIGGVCLPLLASNTIIGTLFIIVNLPREITAGELRVLNALEEIGASAIHRANLYEQTVNQLDRLAALRSIDIAISSSFDLKMTLNVVLDKVTRELNVDAADILLLKPESYTLEYGAGLGFWTRAIESTSLTVGEGFAGKAALGRKIVYLGDLSADPKLVKRSHLVEDEKFVSYYGVPLVAKGKVKGVLEVFSRTKVIRDEEWQQFLEAVAGQTAIAIDSSSLFLDLQRSNLELGLAYDATIEGWSHALDLRDKETEGHTLRVTEMTLKLAQAFGVTDAELVHIRRGSLLHDIGKMGVPDRILLKPDKLTDDEWVSMRKHPEFAYNMLMPITYLRPALDIPYCHHEKWDGTGYPRGLKDEQIPQAARIFAVVDVWDALRSDRPYRPGWKMEDVIKYIREQSGIHFDPRVVDVFLEQVVNT